MKCFYHSADLDGHCSGALIKLRYPDCKMIPIDYGYNPNVWQLSYKPNETVFMVDFCLQPFTEMVELSELCHLIWIDHHKTSVENFEALKVPFKAKTFLNTNMAACMLTWALLSVDLDEYRALRDENLNQAPKWIRLLSKYDCWQDDDKMFWNGEILPFQYGLRSHETEPSSASGLLIWKQLLNSSKELDDPNMLSLYEFVIIDDGNAILKYVEQTNAKKCKSLALETEIEGMKAICMNSGGGSKAFESVYDSKKHDLMISFQWLPIGKWTVSLYATKPNVDVSEIAKKHGGGGHKSAAGFQCIHLPFFI